MKTALVTGITGQDGAYLARLLLAKNYRVYGTYRRTSSVGFWRLEALGLSEHPNLYLKEYDLTDAGSAYRLIDQICPDEIYNLAAQSFVGVSFDQPLATAQITALGVVHLLEAIRAINPGIRFYQASSSEMFGNAGEGKQNEDTPFCPRNPYGIAKLYAHWMTMNSRDAYGIFAVSGLLFNHESPLRGPEFVTRKISDGIARIVSGRETVLMLGNLDARRDWGYAPEYVEGMWRMMQRDRPCNYVLATGRAETVRHFAALTGKAAGLDIVWTGKGVDEKGIDRNTGRLLIAVDPSHYRPAETDTLIGDASKAHEEMGWRSRTSLEDLAAMMLESDLQRYKPLAHKVNSDKKTASG